MLTPTCPPATGGLEWDAGPQQERRVGVPGVMEADGLGQPGAS